MKENAFYGQNVALNDIAAAPALGENIQALKKLGLKRGKYFAVSSHREENVDERRRFTDLLGSLSALRKQYKLPVVVSTHPRTRKRLEALGKRAPVGIRFMPPLGFADYVQLQKSAFCVLSDSGTLTEEEHMLVAFAGQARLHEAGGAF